MVSAIEEALGQCMNRRSLKRTTAASAGGGVRSSKDTTMAKRNGATRRPASADRRTTAARTPTRSCVEKLKALAETTRLQVLHELVEGEKSVTELQRVLGIDQSLLSHHLAVLRDVELVATSRARQSIRYRLADGVAAVGPPAGINLGCCQLSFMQAAAKLLLLMVTLFATWPLAACTPSTPLTKLTLSGSSTIAPLAAELGKAFERHHGGVRVEVQAGGSSRGVADAQAGQVDLGMASRALKEEESAQGLVASTVALDGIGMIVHADNPVTELSAAQIVAIYRGTTRDWSAVGGSTAPITVVNKAEGRSTLELFLAHFKLKPEEVRADLVIGDNAQGLKSVAGNRNAIGYVSIGSAEVEIRLGAPIRLLPLEGIAASSDTVRAATFPLQRPLNLLTKGIPVGLAAEFIDFARSPEGVAIVEAQAFVAPAPIQ